MVKLCYFITIYVVETGCEEDWNATPFLGVSEVLQHGPYLSCNTRLTDCRVCFQGSLLGLVQIFQILKHTSGIVLSFFLFFLKAGICKHLY